MCEGGVVIAEKNCHKGALIGHISNGGGTIDLGNGKALKFVAFNEQFTCVQLIEVGIGKQVKTQTWTKAKKTVTKKPEPTKLVSETQETFEI